MSKNKKLYNYIVNTFGVTREMIKDVVEKRVDIVLENIMKQTMNNSYFEKIILDRVAHMVKNGYPNRYFEKDTFSRSVRDAVYEVVEKKLAKEFQIQVTAKPKKTGKKPKNRTKKKAGGA